MAANNPIMEALSECVPAEGFRRKASTWYSDKEQTILLVNLQRSRWGPQYYVNLAVWVKALGPAALPKEADCHIRCRLGALVPEEMETTVSALLDLENGLGDIDRKTAVAALLRQYGLPVLKECSTLDGIGRLLKGDALKGAAVQVKLLQLLKLPN